MSEAKICSKCQVPKTINEFRKQSATKDGLKYICKTCDNLTQRSCYSSNKKYHKVRTRKWREANKEKSRAYSKAYRERKKLEQFIADTTPPRLE